MLNSLQTPFALHVKQVAAEIPFVFAVQLLPLLSSRIFHKTCIVLSAAGEVLSDADITEK